MIYLGIDLVDVRRVRRFAEVTGDAFVNAGWTTTEQSECRGDARRLAAVWAAKEAAMKALGVGLGDVDPVEIEVYDFGAARPRIALHGGALDHANALGISRMELSISRDRETVLAMVMALGDGDD